MSIEEVIVQKLRAAAAVTALVGVGDQARIYLEVPEQGAVAPYVVFQVVSGVPESSQDSRAGDFAFSRVQVSSWSSIGTGDGSARALAMAVEEALLNVESSDFSAWRESEHGAYDTETSLYGVQADYLVGV